MKKTSENWIIIPKASATILRWGKIARQQRKDHNLSSNSSARIKCEHCDTPVMADSKQYKEEWVTFFRKGQIEKDENDGYAFRTRIEFYCLNCQNK